MNFLLLMFLLGIDKVPDPSQYRVIVFEFNYSGGDREAPAGIAGQFRRQLAAHEEFMNIMPPEDYAADVLRTARNTGADYLISGSIIQIGSTYDIKFDLIEVATGSKVFFGQQYEAWDAGPEKIAEDLVVSVLEKKGLLPALALIAPEIKQPEVDSIPADTVALTIVPVDSIPDTMIPAVKQGAKNVYIPPRAVKKIRHTSWTTYCLRGCLIVLGIILIPTCIGGCL